MKEDVAGNVHRKLYGMSDKINAPENQNRVRHSIDANG
jgi:hypothetical protein